MCEQFKIELASGAGYMRGGFLMIKERFTTFISVEKDWGQRAIDLKTKGIGYAEIFRQGVQFCEEYLIKKGAD